MGHGLTSAIFTTELKHTMRAYIREHEQPARILYHLNQFLYQSGRLFHEGLNSEGSDSPVCIALAVVARETGVGTLAIAGMEPPILVRADGRTEQSAAGVFSVEPRDPSALEKAAIRTGPTGCPSRSATPSAHDMRVRVA